jgi:hypothetical protein
MKVLLPPYRIKDNYAFQDKFWSLILIKKYKIYYIKIISLDSYSKELSNDMIFMLNISYFLTKINN